MRSSPIPPQETSEVKKFIFKSEAAGMRSGHLDNGHVEQQWNSLQSCNHCIVYHCIFGCNVDQKNQDHLLLILIFLGICKYSKLYISEEVTHISCLLPLRDTNHSFGFCIVRLIDFKNL